MASGEVEDGINDLGNGMTLVSFWADIDEMRDRQNKYSELLFTKAERMLHTVAVVYGHKSSECEIAGGKRRTERRRSSQSAGEQQLVA